MKKALLLTLIAIAFGFAVNEANARYAKNGWRSCYEGPCCEPKSCEKKCDPCQPNPCGTCNIVKVIEDPCCAPCCERYVRVEEPALVTKHISYSYECPAGCTPAQKQAGMLQAGQTSYSSAGPVSQKAGDY